MLEYLTCRDAGRELRISPVAVRALVLRGKLPTAGRTRSGIYLLHPADVEALKIEREDGLRRRKDART